MPRRVSYPAILGPVVGPYSQGVKTGGLLFMSGLTAFGTPAQGKGAAEQLDTVLKQLAAVAAAEGRDLGALVKVTIYATTLDDLAGLRSTLQRNYAGQFPASSLVRVAALFDSSVSIEVEAVFAVP